MPTADYIRVRTGRPPEFIRSNTFSHRHHHRHRRCHDDCCGVSRTEYNNLVEQNHSLVTENAKLSKEKDALKKELCQAENANRAWSAEAERLRDINGRLSSDNDILRDENDRLRRSISSEDDHIKGFKRRIKVLEREAREQERMTRAEIEDLTENLAKSNDVAHQWKRKCEEWMAKYDKLKRTLYDYEVTIAEQKDKIDHLKHQLRRYWW
ncbi:hypothetical protein PFICI_03406 [Pestalotiopsis fici W106-1]|uniref:Uncharacterized protein n=1 Tax=Pestalotiopsis fici (strain W106-1 / CGMCC3.15140) TaxID=1229662 RepID=W3XJI2_PESFW|nr:uncharacterized protein PFICI_03406 [Pestalotiopsis fici W106-1]ETS85381.1 hypothetical protein PFICI_03406 [Pestalotiopsis fici W106-1]